MPNRHGGEYRFGFGGMEQDNEVKGKGNSYTTEFRQYDARLMRWLSLDPLAAKFPWQSPYVAFDNNPVLINDPNGLAGKKANLPNPKRDKRRRARENRRTERIKTRFNNRFERYNNNLPDGQKVDRREFLDLMVDRTGVAGFGRQPRWLANYLTLGTGRVSRVSGGDIENPSIVRVVDGGSSLGPVNRDIIIPFESGEIFFQVDASTQGNSGGVRGANLDIQFIASDGSVISSTTLPVVVNGGERESVRVPYNRSKETSSTVTLRVVKSQLFVTGILVEISPDNKTLSEPTISEQRNPQYKKRVRKKIKLFR